MTQPSNSDSGNLPASSSRPKSERRDTLLLSDVPTATQILQTDNSAEPPPGSASSSQSSSALEVPSHLSSLGSGALAALAQRYEVIAEAGHGSMGNVYKARDRETGETVALKLLKHEIASDQAMMDRFKNELLFARKITHKNVCRVHEFNRAGSLAYTSMEFVEGESLRSVLTRFGALAPRKAIDLALQICSGLKEAHAQGIVHRDLKPENVMIDSHGNVKIMDFGIARSMEAGTRLTGSMIGTPAYMAPEQVAGKPIDYRTDIYSLGLILYEMFTGSQVFQADTAVALALKHLRESPVPPHQLDPSIPAAVERAILKALEKEPARRFQSVAEMQIALRSTGSGTPVAAPAATTGSHHSTQVPPVTFDTDPPSPVSSSGVPATRGSSSASGSAPIRLAPTQLFAASPAASVPDRRSRGTSPIVWILIGALAVLGVFAGAKVAARTKAINQIPAPALPHSLIPVPPDFALQKTPVIPASGSSAPEPASTGLSAAPVAAPDATHAVAADKSASKSGGAKSVTINPPPSDFEQARAKASAAILAADAAPGAVQQRAERAFGEAPDTAAALASLKDGMYIRVARDTDAQKARKDASKLKSLGLPSHIIPRHSIVDGPFWLVLAGPYDSKRQVQNTIEFFETQGFSNVVEFNWPMKFGAKRPAKH
ncbi:MAG: protein kinase [Candidatus Acidiferrales bacterium]